jgi:hypothetical protein
MKQLLLFLILLPVFLRAQNNPDSNKLKVTEGLKEKVKSILPNLQVVRPLNAQNAYRTLPWLHRFLDTASATSISRFLTEGNDSTLQLVHYETMTARHAYFMGEAASDPDKDGDGFRSISVGGNDCDDLDNNNYPGNAERCQGYYIFTAWEKKYIIIAKYHDEDCSPGTIAGAAPDGDDDRDNQVSCSCLNYASEIPAGYGQVAIAPTISAIMLGNPNRRYTIRGFDCDDHNPALIRVSQVCRDERTIAVCENGKWRNYPCRRCVTQPNGSGVVVEQ